jgi:hypothetical protein
MSQVKSKVHRSSHYEWLEIPLLPYLARAIELERTKRKMSRREALVDAIEKWCGLPPSTFREEEV